MTSPGDHEPAPRLRFVSWNVNGFADRGQGDYLADQAWDVCAVQEATTSQALESLADRVRASSFVSARPLLSGATEQTPSYVSALLARSPFTVADAAVLTVPSPERALHAIATCGDRRIVVASMALPPATSRAWGPRTKVEQAEGIAGWLAGLTGPVIVGIDANTPKVDHPDLGRSVWWNAGEGRLLGTERTHRLRDAYREAIERDPEGMAELVAARPNGPLAVSYRRGHGDRATDCRYDSILASPDLAVIAAGYEYQRSIDAGSDHALVWADLELPTSPS